MSSWRSRKKLQRVSPVTCMNVGGLSRCFGENRRWLNSLLGGADAKRTLGNSAKRVKNPKGERRTECVGARKIEASLRGLPVGKKNPPNEKKGGHSRLRRGEEPLPQEAGKVGFRGDRPRKRMKHSCCEFGGAWVSARNASRKKDIGNLKRKTPI